MSQNIGEHEITLIPEYNGGRVYAKIRGTDAYVLDKQGQPRSWANIDNLIQWAARRASKGELYRISGAFEYDKPIIPKQRRIKAYGTHRWKKANVIPLTDNRGQYDKMVCQLCGKVSKRYKGNRLFDERYGPCPENPLL